MIIYELGCLFICSCEMHILTLRCAWNDLEWYWAIYFVLPFRSIIHFFFLSIFLHSFLDLGHDNFLPVSVISSRYTYILTMLVIMNGALKYLIIWRWHNLYILMNMYLYIYRISNLNYRVLHRIFIKSRNALSVTSYRKESHRDNVYVVQVKSRNYKM